MTKEEIQEAFRKLGHGFVNHELVERLAEFLADTPEESEAQEEPQKKRGRPRKVQ